MKFFVRVLLNEQFFPIEDRVYKTKERSPAHIMFGK